MQLHAFQERKPRYIAMYPHEVMYILQGYMVRGGPLWHMEAANHFLFFNYTQHFAEEATRGATASLRNNRSNKDQFQLMLNSIKYCRTELMPTLWYGFREMLVF